MTPPPVTQPDRMRLLVPVSGFARFKSLNGRIEQINCRCQKRCGLEKLVLIKLFKQCHCIAPDFQNGSMIGHLSFLKHFPWNHTPLA